MIHSMKHIVCIIFILSLVKWTIWYDSRDRLAIDTISFDQKSFNPDARMLLITKFNIFLGSFCLIKRLITIYVGMGNWCPVEMLKTDAFDHKNAIQPKPRRLKMSREIVIRKDAGEKLGIDLDTYHSEYNKPHVS